MRSLPWAIQLQRQLAKLMLRKPEYTPTLSVNTELMLASMMLDEALVLGAAVPVLPLLGAVAVFVRLAVVRHATSKLGLSFKDEPMATPAWGYFAVSLLLGCALNLFFFVDNWGIVQGGLLVCVMLPTSMVVGAGGAWAITRR